ncbi:MAG: ketol-acid reductoisomerase [Fibromonadales bacterium]|nr:ketol-acid reductoisomerase [Fibromonadales bacterium]
MNYFNTLPLRVQLEELGKCRFMDASEFTDGVEALKGKQIVIIGAGAQGLHQGLNLRDSGLNVSYALRQSAIEERRPSFLNVIENGFKYGVYKELIPNADLVCNLTPDKQHSKVVTEVMPLMKQGSALLYSHGFNIVEEGMQIREDITVIMVAPKGPGSEVRTEYVRGFGMPALIAVKRENNPEGKGLDYAKAYAVGLGSDRAGVLESSFIAEVKSDLMGEQTILCGMLQTGTLLCFDRMVLLGVDAPWASKLLQYGWETISEALKQGGITNMMDRLSNPAKIRAYELSEELKTIMRPLYQKHQDDILSGEFSDTMMKDWSDGDKKLLTWREATGRTAFEKNAPTDYPITEQEYFDKAVLMVAMIKAGVELAFETMVSAGMKPASAYYESLHETPLIANLIARKKLYEMNRVISDTAEYGCYLFANSCIPLLENFMQVQGKDVLSAVFNEGKSNWVDNRRLIEVNNAIRHHPVEEIGAWLRSKMRGMKQL